MTPTRVDPSCYPGRRIAKVNASQRPGDTILFHRGDEWREQLNRGKDCSYGSYGSGARPIVNGAEIV